MEESKHENGHSEAQVAVQSGESVIATSNNLPAEEAATSSNATMDEEHYCYTAKYGKVNVEVRLGISDTVQDLKAILFSMTDVPPERQKILGLARGKLPIDSTSLGEIVYPPASLRDSPHPATGEKRITINLIGTPLDQTFKDPEVETGKGDGKGKKGESLGDIDYSDPETVKGLETVPSNDPHALSKLERAISRFSHTFPIMHEPRKNLKGGLLVLDLDYTMADTKRLLHYQVSAREAERPGLHEFLTAVYPYYDICVWSQTSYWWLEAKLTEMGCLTHPGYQISFVLDRTPMFSVRYNPKNESGSSTSNEHKTKRNKHEVKALEIIWRRFPDLFGAHNTIHIDDLSRNFAMNPFNGLKIKPYKHSPRPDGELPALRDYLLKLAHSSIKDFNSLTGHKGWKKRELPSVKEESEQDQTGSNNNNSTT
ncbi:hypothetical protein L7F22_003012 [Adiantum nelumboides]|nr:hypothetical protein [Adiantum nelumboides]